MSDRVVQLKPGSGGGLAAVLRRGDFALTAETSGAHLMVPGGEASIARVIVDSGALKARSALI